MEMMEAPVEGLPIITCSGSGYNELLYAHLLDNEVKINIFLFCQYAHLLDNEVKKFLKTDIVFAKV